MELMKEFINTSGRMLVQIATVNPKFFGRSGKPLHYWLGVYSSNKKLWSKLKIVMKHGARN